MKQETVRAAREPRAGRSTSTHSLSFSLYSPLAVVFVMRCERGRRVSGTIRI